MEDTKFEDKFENALGGNWTRAIVIGSFSAAAFLLVTGRRPAGFALAGIGLATLAAEHPEKFEQIWEKAPEYLEKGTRIVNNVGTFVEKLAEQGARFQAARSRASEHDYLT
jgi:hypothetical protein